MYRAHLKNRLRITSSKSTLQRNEKDNKQYLSNASLLRYPEDDYLEEKQRKRFQKQRDLSQTQPLNICQCKTFSLLGGDCPRTLFERHNYPREVW